MFTIYAVQFEEGDNLYFQKKEDALKELWNYYLNFYYEDDDEELRIVTKNEFDSFNKISDVGQVLEIEVH